MRILLINKFFYLRGGAERSFFETMRMLEAGGHTVIPFAMQDERNRSTPYKSYFVDKIEFNQDHSLRERIAIVPRVIYFRQARRRLERLLRRERVDLAHLHNIAHQISPSILVSLRKFAVPVVQTLHDYKQICPTYTMLAGGEVCQRCCQGRYYHAIGQRCNKGSLSASLLNAAEMYAHRGLGLYRRGIDLFISPSEFLRRKLKESGMIKTPILYLPNAIDTGQYLPNYGGHDYCVYFGRLSPEKGVKTLIRAMCGLEKLRLLIVGDGLQRRELEELVQEERAENVQFVGALYGDDLHNVVRDALFTVLPSQCYENCPFSVLESFALGKAVIGSDIGGIPELIAAGQDGLLFRPGDVADLRDKMRLLAGDRERNVRMGRHARDKAERRFGIKTHYDRLLAAYAWGRFLKGSGSRRMQTQRRRYPLEAPCKVQPTLAQSAR
jgi:glycosyltransferase involved in cell wall biosynthesis